MLDWDGGLTPLYPGEPLDAMDLTAFPTTDGGTLADFPELFRERVREEVLRVYCEAPDLHVRVLSDGQAGGPYVTRVFITGARTPDGQGHVGEGQYDPCNRRDDDTAVIFGGELLRLERVLSFDDWVTVFANVAAHEIGHTLGFGHVDRNEHLPTERSLFVELMLSAHTTNELRREQRFVVEQDHCPAGTALRIRARDAAVFTCGTGEGPPGP